jgi:PAS domain S-box-containing protein
MDAQQHDPWSIGARPPGGLLHGLSRVSMPRFLGVMLPLSVLFVLGFVFEYRALLGADRARFLTQETSVVQRGVHRAQRELETATGDLLFVGDLVAEAVRSGAMERPGALEPGLVALMRHRPSYARIGFVSATGREIFRVENTSSGTRLASERELEDEIDASYLTNTRHLDPGEVFVSPMEPDPVHGAEGEALEAIVRLATPIEDAAGQRRGSVVLTADAGDFLRAFERDTEDTDVERMIVDADGYWLRYRPELDRGFTFERGRSFQQAFPEISEQMAARQRGRIESGDGLFHFDAVSAGPTTSGSDAGTRSPWLWTFISLVPRQVLDDIMVRIATRLVVIAMPAYFLLLAIGWLLAAAFESRRTTEEALKNLERVRNAMMRAALDAIVVMDEAGTTLEFNPMAQQIFGYTLEEARGRQVADLIIPPTHREAHHQGLSHYLATGEGPIIDKHIDGLTAIRKGGAEFPVELTVCPINVGGKRLFFGFLRDQSGSGTEARTRDRVEWVY